MSEQPVSQLEEKVQILINNYKELKEKNESLNVQVIELTNIKYNNSQTIEELHNTIEKLEIDLSEKNDKIAMIEEKCDEYMNKLSNYENVTKSTSSQIDNILSQLSKL